MKVGELVERLEDMDFDLEVMIEYPSHGHWKIASPVTRIVGTFVTRSKHHKKAYMEIDEDGPADALGVVLITML